MLHAASVGLVVDAFCQRAGLTSVEVYDSWRKDEFARAISPFVESDGRADGATAASTEHAPSRRWGAEIEVRHTATDFSVRVPRDEYERLLTYQAFRELDDRDRRWADEHVLVTPGVDATLKPHLGSEAALAADVSRWYWREHEVESERSYTWLGRPIVKSPSDLFFYQELIATRRMRRILELGAGDGGGLAFFAFTLATLEGGVVVGVELDAPRVPVAMPHHTTVSCYLIDGDALNADVVSRVQRTSLYF